MYAFVAILFVILTYGMETTFFRFSESEKNKSLVFSTAFLSVLLSSLIFVVLIITNSFYFANWLGYPGNTNYVVWFGLILVFDAISAIPFAKLRQQNKAIKFVIIRLINIGINIGLNLFFILLCPFILKNSDSEVLVNFVNYIFKPDNIVGYIFISNLIASGITLLLLIPEFPGIRLNFSFRLWKHMLVYALPLLIVGVAGSINLSIDKILLPRLLPDHADAMSQVGIYGACYKISIIMTLFVQTFRYAADPFFFSQSGQKDAKKLYADVLKFFTIAVSLIFLLTMMYIDVVIKFIGEDYRSGAGVIPILLLGNLFLGIFYNFSIWYKLTNRTYFGAILSVIGATITLVLNFLLIPYIGYFGSAWAAFFAYFTMMIMSYFLSRKYFPVPYDLKRIAGYLIFAVLLFLISEFIPIEKGLIRILVNTIFVFIYLAVVLIFEKKTIKQL